MLKKHIWLGGVLLLMIVVGVAYAVANNSFSISWWTVDGGGGTSEGGSYSASGTVGQPDAGDLSAGGYDLAGGYWTSDKTLLYLPMIMKNFCGGFEGPREIEPENNSENTANGPLCLFRTYIGSPNDDSPGRESDYFKFNWNGGRFTVNVTNFLTNKAQVQLYYESTLNLLIDPPISEQASGNYIFSYSGGAGTYLVRVVADPNHDVGEDYNLRITAP